MPRTGARRSLVTVDGQIGEMKSGEFIQYTNFVFEIVSAVSSPAEAFMQLDGFLYKVKTTSGVEKECFITNDEACTIRGFTKAAAKSLKGVQHIKCSDSLWGRYIFQECSNFRTSSSFRSKTLVSAIGCQPNSDIWVLGPDVQINSKGELLQHEDFTFYWHAEYQLRKDVTDDTKIAALPISLPLQLAGIQNLMIAAKECLQQNFLSFYQIISGVCMAMHFESIMLIQDECPLVMAYSETPGTGKTTSLRAALSLCGAAVGHFRVGKSTPTSLVTRASITTIPIGVDDINSLNNIETLSVQFFNGAALSTVSNGSNSPRTSIIFTSNKTFAESSRNAARLIHVPFFKGPIAVDQREKEESLKQACLHASSSIGLLISIGEKIRNEQFQKCINEDLLPLVHDALPDADFRIQKSYALLLGIGKELCSIIEQPDVITFTMIKQFFSEKWAPEVTSLLQPSHSTIESVLEQLLYDTEDLEVCEMLRFLRPEVSNKNNSAHLSVAIYLPMIRTYCSTLDEAKFKKAVKEVGGNIRASLPFLKDGSNDTILKPSENGKQKKCITIPHSAVSRDLIGKLVDRVQSELNDSDSSSSLLTSLSSTPGTADCEPSELSNFNSPLSPPSLYIDSQDIDTHSLHTSVYQDTFIESSPSSLNLSEIPSKDDTISPVYSPVTSMFELPRTDQDTIIESSPSSLNLSEILSKDDTISPVYSPVTSMFELPSTALVSLDPNSEAIIRHKTKITKEKKSKQKREKKTTKKRQKCKAKKDKSKCPPSICILKRETRNTLYIQCDDCDQWYHQWCLQIPKKKAENEPYRCKNCSCANPL